MALRTKDYNGYGTYNRAYNHLSSNDPNIQRDYDNGVLNSQFLRNQSQFIQNVNADPWATVGTLLGAVAANMKRDYDERGAQKTSEGIFNSLGLAEQQPTQYTQNGQAISMDNPNGEVQQQPSVLDQLSQGVTIGNQVVQGIAQDRKNSIIENAMNKWGADPNANQTAIALQDATDGVNANFVLGTGPTRSQMINTAIERGRQAGLNQYQLDALSKRVGEAYDARYDKDLKQYNQDMSGQVSAALQNRDYNKVSGLLTDMTAINPTLATSLGNIAKIRMDNDIQQQRINEMINAGARKAGVETRGRLIGGYKPWATKDMIKSWETQMKLDANNGAESYVLLPDGTKTTPKEAIRLAYSDIGNAFDGYYTGVPSDMKHYAEMIAGKLATAKTPEEQLTALESVKSDLTYPELATPFASAMARRGMMKEGELWTDYRDRLKSAKGSPSNVSKDNIETGGGHPILTAAGIAAAPYMYNKLSDAIDSGAQRFTTYNTRMFNDTGEILPYKVTAKDKVLNYGKGVLGKVGWKSLPMPAVGAVADIVLNPTHADPGYPLSEQEREILRKKKAKK